MLADMSSCFSARFLATLGWALLVGWFCRPADGADSSPASERWWPDRIETALRSAGTNRAELTKALREVPSARREGLQFLIEHMPEPDRQALTAGFLLENVQLAYDQLEQAPWARQIPRDIFLDAVLPYASLNERRDNWRQLLIDKCRPLLTNCATPAEAAQALNRQLFKATNVRYSTQRRRADQGPLETMESGLATCTGLSILLVDACRAMGVPARVAATPMWANNRGNHTWVEIWDQGWHFTGAAEPDPKGLDRGWFRGDAAQAKADDREHAIYASSFARTGTSFPLAWAPDIAWVNAENVTDRYTAKPPAADTNRVQLEVKVIERPGGPRVAARVKVTDPAEPTRQWDGTSRDETADLNNILPFEVHRRRAYSITVEHAGRTWRREFQSPAGTNRAELFVLALSEPREIILPTQVCAVPLTGAKKLAPNDEARLRREVAAYFTAPTNDQAGWKFSRALDQLLTRSEREVRRLVWEEFKASAVQKPVRDDFQANRVRFQKYESPYTVKSVGTKPPGGWALFIAMHGGGGAPKAVNDSQWQVMQRYYRDHPEAGGYLYVALRAPNDTWNGFYDTYVYPLVANLVRQFLVCGEVDPNKVFIMGYSHGGYGAYAIGPKIPDRFAAIHASAAAATDGETTPKTLRNTIFTAMVGEKDTMYGRLDRNRRFQESVDQLRGGRTDIYPVNVQVIAGNGHTGLPDRDKIAAMYPAVRQPAPRELTWLQTDQVVHDFFWLRTGSAAKKREINAAVRENRVTVTTTTNVSDATVLLDQRLVDFQRSVTFDVNGQVNEVTLKPSLMVLCQTLQRRGDPDLAATAEVRVLPIATSSTVPAKRWSWFGLRPNPTAKTTAGSRP